MGGGLHPYFIANIHITPPILLDNTVTGVAWTGASVPAQYLRGPWGRDPFSTLDLRSGTLFVLL